MANWKQTWDSTSLTHWASSINSLWNHKPCSLWRGTLSLCTEFGNYWFFLKWTVPCRDNCFIYLKLHLLKLHFIATFLPEDIEPFNNEQTLNTRPCSIDEMSLRRFLNLKPFFKKIKFKGMRKRFLAHSTILIHVNYKRWPY